jgi:hypothetical protein
MAHGVIADYLSLFFVREVQLVSGCRLTLLVDSFYKNIVLYMTQFWVRRFPGVHVDITLNCVSSSSPSSTTFRVRLPMSHGRYHFTMFCLRFYLRS